MAKEQTTQKKGTGSSKSKKKILLLALEVLVLVAAVCILVIVMNFEKKNPGRLNIEEEDLDIHVDVAENETMKGYRNIALFGVDSTTGSLGKDKESKTRSDTIIIASINEETKEVKLVSVYRDTFLNLGNDTYTKCNAAYQKGGPEQAIQMLNTNLDMDIKDFVTIGFKGLKDVVDALGGVEIEIKKGEISHLNNYQYSMAEDMKIEYTPVKEPGVQTLNGLQAVAYCRIRQIGNDFQRTERQRTVLTQISEKAKTMSASQLNEIATSAFEEVYTSLELQEILDLIQVIGEYKIVDSAGFPQMDMLTTGTIGSHGSCVVPLDLAESVVWLHEYLFDVKGYEVTERVQTNSDTIDEKTSIYLN
ncbi:MAG: LCP family protein [Lachnospiraceae bacterium]|nr:LCP family protein [Lachnospiraceae bacterium]